MKELNLIALLGFYLICPKETAAQRGAEFLTQKVVEASQQAYSWHDNWKNVYFLTQKETLQKTADAVAQTVEPKAAITFSESKPIIQDGKRFVRPKIIGES